MEMARLLAARASWRTGKTTSEDSQCVPGPRLSLEPGCVPVSTQKKTVRE